MVEQEIRDVLESYGLRPQAGSSHVARLAWSPPRPGCPHKYRIRTEYTPPLRFEDDSTSTLELHAPDRDDGWGELQYQGVRSENRVLRRRYRMTPSFAGPASPTVACLAQTWDPVEDALAIAWPKLPDRVVAVGESWTGLRVGAKCSRSPCVDPETGAGGPPNHHRTCVAPWWAHTFAGQVDVAGHRIAVVTSRWSDGHHETDPTAGGIWSTGRALLSVDRGRPLYVQLQVHQSFSEPLADGSFGPVLRTWTLQAVDDCSPTLASLAH